MIGGSPIYAKDMRITLNTSPGRDAAEKHEDWGPAGTHPTHSEAQQVRPRRSLDAKTRCQEQPWRVSTRLMNGMERKVPSS